MFLAPSLARSAFGSGAGSIFGDQVNRNPIRSTFAKDATAGGLLFRETADRMCQPSLDIQRKSRQPRLRDRLG